MLKRAGWASETKKKSWHNGNQEIYKGGGS
jgi:hypothetical protein